MAIGTGRCGDRSSSIWSADAAAGDDAARDADLIRVLAAVIRDEEGRWLLCQRPAAKRHGGAWEFPGGKLDPGESLEDAARRELREELDLDVVAVGDVLFRCQDPGSSFLIEFADVRVRGTPVPLEHDAIRWANAADAGALRLAPADRAFADSMARR